MLRYVKKISLILTDYDRLLSARFSIPLPHLKKKKAVNRYLSAVYGNCADHLSPTCSVLLRIFQSSIFFLFCSVEKFIFFFFFWKACFQFFFFFTVLENEEWRKNWKKIYQEVLRLFSCFGFICSFDRIFPIFVALKIQPKATPLTNFCLYGWLVKRKKKFYAHIYVYWWTLRRSKFLVYSILFVLFQKNKTHRIWAFFLIPKRVNCHFFYLFISLTSQQS